MDEIWGCVKHVGIPYDTVMRMPIHNRRYFILRHNDEQEKISSSLDKNKGSTQFFGENVNSFSRNIQNSPLNGRT